MFISNFQAPDKTKETNQLLLERSLTLAAATFRLRFNVTMRPVLEEWRHACLQKVAEEKLRKTKSEESIKSTQETKSKAKDILPKSKVTGGPSPKAQTTGAPTKKLAEGGTG